MNRREIITLAILIAFLPPIWAVSSKYMGNSVGPIALITAGIYAANGNKISDAGRISAGLIAGDIWAYAVNMIIPRMPANEDMALFITLAIFGFLAVVISQYLDSIFHMPSWLAGWAIAMLTMNLDNNTNPISLAFQIGVSMLVGVYYVGVLIDIIHGIINRKGKEKKI